MGGGGADDGSFLFYFQILFHFSNFSSSKWKENEHKYFFLKKKYISLLCKFLILCVLSFLIDKYKIKKKTALIKHLADII